MANLKSDRPNQLTQPKTSCLFNQNMTADDKLECQQQKGTFSFLLWHSLTLYRLHSSVGRASPFQGAQWLSGRVLDLRPKGCEFEPQRRHWVVVLEQDTFILA